MREIKFRAKSLDTGEWVYGWYVSGDYIPDMTNYEQGWIMHFGRLQGALKKIQVDPKTRGEFIGLKDKNNKDIYEEDVLKIFVGSVPGKYDGEAKVYYNTEKTGFMVDGVLVGYFAPEDLEVIGNIYETLAEDLTVGESSRANDV